MLARIKKRWLDFQKKVIDYSAHYCSLSQDVLGLRKRKEVLKTKRERQSRMRFAAVLLLVAVTASAAAKEQPVQDQCFCQLKGHVDDCSCDVNTVDYFNNDKIFPRLKSLLDKDFFRYFEYNPNKKCPFFDEARQSTDKCASPSCGVQSCAKEDLPPGLAAPAKPDCDDDVDDSLSDQAIRDIADWKDHDDNHETGGFCEVDGAAGDCKDCVHVDLTKNPERHTGYSGEAAHKVWRTIYQENCFRPAAAKAVTKAEDVFLGKPAAAKAKEDTYFVPQERLHELCLEKRAFYRAISGLHASITVHLSSRFPKKLMAADKKPVVATFQPASLFGGSGDKSDEDEFGPNLDLFLARFDPDKTHGQGPFWLKNLYFVYLLELRALLKAKPFLLKQTFYTGNADQDEDTRRAVAELLGVVSGFPNHYDETVLFAGKEPNLRAEFQDHFRNISRVMDCVSCDKCKLWGKLQTNGLGTALKILVTADPSRLNLSRNEVVALFNAFGRISTSIQQLENFRQQLRSREEEGDKSKFEL